MVANLKDMRPDNDKPQIIPLYKEYNKESQGIASKAPPNADKMNLPKSLPVKVRPVLSEQKLTMRKFEDTFRVPSFSRDKYT